MDKTQQKNLVKIDFNEVFTTTLKVTLFAVILVGGSSHFLVEFSVAKFELVFVTLFLFNKVTQDIDYEQTTLSALPTLDKTLLIMLFITISVTTLTNNDLEPESVKVTVVVFSIVFSMLHIAFLICLISSCTYFKINITDYSQVLPYTVSFICLFFIFMQTTEYPSRLYEGHANQGVPFFANARYLGYLVTASSSMLVIDVLRTDITLKKSLFVSLLFITNLGLLVWLGGRGSLVAFTFAVVLYLSYLMFLGQLNIHRLGLLVVLVITSFYLAYICSVFYWNGPYSFLRSLLSEPQETAFNINKLTSNRIAIWTQAIEAIVEKPWFGHGVEGYRFHPLHIFGLQPHNVFLQLLVAYGTLGTSIFIYFYVKVLTVAIKQIFQQTNQFMLDCRTALMIIVSLSIHGLVDGTFYHSQPLFLIIISISAIITVRIRNDQLSNGPK